MAAWRIHPRGAARGLGLVLLSVSTPVLAGQRPPVEEAVQALTVAAGGSVRVRRSVATEVLSFLAAPEGGVIPVSDAAAVTPEARAVAFVRRYAGAFGLAAESDLAITKVAPPDAQGMDHVRLQQRHRGVPVTGAEMTVHLRGTGVVAVLAKTLPDLDEIDVEPRLARDVAERAALEAVAKEAGRSADKGHTIRLEVFNRGLLEGGMGVTRLAWLVEVRAEGLREYVWVDARRGVVLLRFSQMPEAKNRRVHTANNGPALPGTLIRGEGAPATGDVDADAAYDFSGDAYDYFATEHGRDSFDGAGASIVSTVHYCPQGGPCPYANAAWTGSQLLYGQGFSRADDVAVHEFTHALTENTANLFYYMQSGALNESISDIFGETVDLTNDRGNDAPSARWLMGEDVPGLGAVRNMMDPTQFGDPGRTSDGLRFQCIYSDNGGVHTNSGVPNHAYALMADGGAFNGKDVVGIGLQKASQVVYRALTAYLTSASGFADYYHAIKQSCEDLVSAPGGFLVSDCEQVERALDAVELHTWGCTRPQSLSTPCDTDLWLAIPAFADNLEDLDSGNWRTGYAVGGNHWTGGAGRPPIYWTGFATSGSWSFWGYDAPDRANSWVEMTRSVKIPSAARLQFKHSYDFEYFDGGIVEYSTDEGASWREITTFNPGGAVPNVTLGRYNPLRDHTAFSGTSFGYTVSQVYLDSLAGSNVRFRFHIGTDPYLGNLGWFIDDVSIYKCHIKPGIQAEWIYVPEGNSGTTPAVFSVNLTVPLELPVSVDYAADPDTATRGSDFLATSGTLTFPPGVTSRPISVPIVGDRINEYHLSQGDEVFWLTLSNPTNAVLGPTARAMIMDDDLAGLVVSDTDIVEPRTGSANATFTVAQPEGQSTTVTVAYQTADGTAKAPADYEPTNGTITLAPAETMRTITVPVKASPTSLSPRTFHLDLSNPSRAQIIRARGTATIYEPGFYPVPPCRVLDTRVPENAPALSSGSTREVVVGSKCGIPERVTAVSLNVTVVSPTGAGDLRIFSPASGMPLVSAINYAPGQTRANNAVVSLSPEGRLSVFCEQAAGEVDLVLDVNGFFQ